jgi:pilus assembly protein CpaB
MSSALRLSVIMVLLFATAALALIAYNMMHPAPLPAAVTASPAAPLPATVQYFAAVRPLSRGTLARQEDFTVRTVPRERLPAGAIIENDDTKAGLTGSLIRRFVDAGSPITQDDILRPHESGFLASVLAPDSRAVSIKVDEETGVAGLVRPGDHVDVVLTQVFEKADPARRATSETVLRNVRVIAIDQEIVQGGQSLTNALGKMAQTVSLELTADQVKKVTVAKQLGTLSLAVRAAVDQWSTANNGTVSSCDASSEPVRQNVLIGQNTAVVVQSGAEVKHYSVRKQDLEDTEANVSCDRSENNSHRAAVVMNAGRQPEKR